jgi:hypothetical protein
MRAEIGPALESRLSDAGIATPFTGPELGSLLSAVGTGLLLQHDLEPAAVDPELLPRAMRQLLGLPQRTASTG